MTQPLNVHDEITKLKQEYFDLECRAVGRLNTIEVRDARIKELQEEYAECRADHQKITLDLLDQLSALKGMVAMLHQQIKEALRVRVYDERKAILEYAINNTQATAQAYEQEVEARGAVKALMSAANICEKFATERFHEHGSYETDTGASYYSGAAQDEYEIRDEEDTACADALRHRAEELRKTSKKG